MRFNEETHSYVDSNGEVYISATSFIKNFSKPFERQKIAAKYAKKHKRDINEVLAEWDKAGKEAITKGLVFHKMKEDELLGVTNILIDDEEHFIFPSVYEDGDKVTRSQQLEPGVYPELCVWSEKYKIAGQADYVEITRRRVINIDDYKTSKEIRLKGFEQWNGSVDKMKYPISHLDDCNFIHYALQLNLYAFLIKQHNRDLKIGKLTIKHILGELDGDKFKIDQIVKYPVPDLQKEIRIMLEHHKKNL